MRTYEVVDLVPPSGFSWVAVPFLAAPWRRANERNLERLKSILETGGVG